MSVGEQCAVPVGRRHHEVPGCVEEPTVSSQTGNDADSLSPPESRHQRGLTRAGPESEPPNRREQPADSPTLRDREGGPREREKLLHARVRRVKRSSLHALDNGGGERTGESREERKGGRHGGVGGIGDREVGNYRPDSTSDCDKR